MSEPSTETAPPGRGVLCVKKLPGGAKKLIGAGVASRSIPV